MELWRKKRSGSSSGLILKAALDYGRLGWSVIPIEPRGEVALIPWEVHQYRLAEVPEIAEWLRRWPDANLAVVTGVASGLVVLGIDPRGGAEAGIRDLCRQRGPLPETVESLTGGGGRHLFFAHPGSLVPGRIALAPGVELYGDGGYVVVPPSRHESGDTYRWTRAPDVFYPVPLPDWLLDFASAGSSGQDRHPTPDWRRLLREGPAAGDCTDALRSLAVHLMGQGVDPDVARELLFTWSRVRCPAPLAEVDIKRLVESILTEQGG